MRAAAPDASACDRCHAPLAAVLGRAAPLAAEGVTCEVCHAISQVTLTADSAAWSLQLAENRKYGPLCDVRDPYFHRAGCSPLHADSRLCAACHHLGASGAPGVPVFSEFAEWQHGGAMSAGLHCQSCHMSKRAGPVASGGPQRTVVSTHGDGPATGDALKLEARAVLVADGLELRGALRVDGAGHAVPAGLPGRELALIADLVDGTGQKLAGDSVVYSRVLVDAAGREAPFWAAERVGADTRLQADETRAFVLRLPSAPPGAALELRLVDRPLSAALAGLLAIEPPPPRVLQTRRFTAPWEPAP